MELRRPETRHTVHDWVKWPGDWELWYGEAVALQPPVFGHGDSQSELNYLIRDQLRRKEGCRCKVAVEVDWLVSIETGVRPDLVIVCDRDIDPDERLKHAPRLIGEILSPSTSKIDREAKWDLYADRGVGFYLLVDPKTRTVEANHLVDGAYQPLPLEKGGFGIELHDGCAVRVPQRLPD